MSCRLASRRWWSCAAVLGAAVLGAACRGDDAPESPTVAVASYAAVPAKQLDVLFQLDDSGTVDALSLLRGSIGGLFESLATLDGGLPDLHVGVITSDLGTSASEGEPAPPFGSPGQGGCADRGRDGALTVNGQPVNDAFLIDEDDGGLRRRNYTGDLSATVGGMLLVGGGGCGFEQPLAATMRAFHNDANVGFSRPDANLLLVILADEDDCSVRDPAFFGPADATLGPLSSYRCTRFGLTCAEPIDSVGPKTDCRPREDSPYLDGVAPFIDFMRLLRGDTARVAVAAIVGPPDVAIALRTPPAGEPVLALAHSCQAPTAADPAVRIAAAVDALGPNSVRPSLCTDPFAPAVAEIARVARGLFGVTCLETERLAAPPACNVVLQSAAGDTPLPLCPATGDCFEIVTDAAACPLRDHQRLLVHLADPQPDTYVRARCVARED